jgi:amino acid adenylation domain-containing protein
MALHRYFIEAASRYPGNAAIQEPSGASITYRDLDELTDRMRDRLVRIGVAPGDRVGVHLHKSIDSVASILGILKCGAAYVPVDPMAPPSRSAYIFKDCSVRAIVTEVSLTPALGEELREQGADPPLLALRGVGGGRSLRAWMAQEDALAPAPPARTVESRPDDLAYILYTSGSTGRPKGVMLSHRNARRFVDWCSDTFKPVPHDRFSSHAPFHFDLSILDIYVPLKHGATLVLIPEDIGKEPLALAGLIASEKLTIWYSTPSILSLLTQYGKMETYDYASLRLVLFAGEVFPIVHLRALKERLPHPRYFNLYGPTETNVCTFYELPPAIEHDRTEPYPIGIVCSHYHGLIVDAGTIEVERGTEGELLIQGDGVMQGYWNLPEQNERVFLDLGTRGRCYRTGDLVVEQVDGNLKFIGRKDRMVKKRGYRVELGEIEACLYRHPNVREAAVVALPDEQEGIKVIAHVATRNQERISLIELKQFCSQHLPLYFIPDLFQFHPVLPKTSTDKIDYQRLQAQTKTPVAGSHRERDPEGS